MKNVIFNIIPCLICSISVAQSEPSDSVFYDINWMRTSDRSAAVYYRETDYYALDSTIIVEDYYLNGGALQMIGYYRDQIKPGKEILKDTSGKWVHKHCADTADELP